MPSTTTTQTKTKSSKNPTNTPPDTVQKTESPPEPSVPTTTTEPKSQVVDDNSSNTPEDLNDSFKSICSSLSTLVGELKTLTTEVKKLEKRVTKELKESKKSRKVKKTPSSDKPKRAPSGFAKPSNISEELCEFLGRPLGTMMARTEVTKHVTQYIRTNELQNPENKRHILPDKKLANLLNSTKNDEVTYFNLQKYMKHHFPKSEAIATTVA